MFYLADFDPAGFEMPANVGRKLQALRDLEFGELEFECRQVALTHEQVKRLGLPSTPLKAAEQRGDRWREAWGVEQTEIDALATLRPAVLGRIVREALAPFYDETLDDRLREAERDWKDEAQELIDRQLDAKVLRDLRQEAEVEAERFAQAIAALNVRIAAATGSADIELPPLVIPEPEIDEDDHGKPLVSSEWSWVEQTEALIDHKAYRNGNENGDAA